MKKEIIIECLKRGIKEEISNAFTGLGIVVIDDNLPLPISNLLNNKEDLSRYQNEASIVSFLIEISNYSDKRHDGFHILSLKKGLLHISQYFSPPIPDKFDHTVYGVGARHRTAQYGSLCNGVSLIIVVGQQGKISIVKGGIVKDITDETS